MGLIFTLWKQMLFKFLSAWRCRRLFLKMWGWRKVLILALIVEAIRVNAVWFLEQFISSQNYTDPSDEKKTYYPNQKNLAT